MYIRFTILAIDDESHQPTGVFQAAFVLRDSGKLADYELGWLEKELSWLRMHMKSPRCLREPGNARALSWFKPEAKRPIEKIRSINALLEEHGLLVRQHTTSDPGSTIYEDGWQIVAKPRRKRARSRTEMPDHGPSKNGD